VLAEQTGSSLARVLRDQAEYIRVRRRERAMAKALALPAKLVVPTVLFFVPAILVLALGPVYFNFLSVMNSILNNGSF
jgi:tight adherence protein C